MLFLAFPMLQFARNLLTFTRHRRTTLMNRGRITLSLRSAVLFGGILLACLFAPASFVFAQDAKNPTAEMLAEGVIITNGGRGALLQIRRNGIEHGKVLRFLPDGHIEEGRYDLKFVRGATAAKDKVRI